MKKLQGVLIAALVAGSFGTVALPALADTIVVQTAPPPPRAERMPHARRGWVWSPGHWEWRHNRHVWVRGMWLRERHGYSYTAPTWVERDGHWVMERGGWHRGERDMDRDRDHDRDHDHDRDGPRRGNRDNDGDGVRNRDDARPNNPNRS